MRTEFLKILSCPNCHQGDLQPSSPVDCGELLSGILRCKPCGLDFPIEDGIPRLLPRNLMEMESQEIQQWQERYQKIEDSAIDDDRPTYKQRHRTAADSAGIDQEVAGYLWENLLFDEAVEAFSDIPKAHGIQWTRDQDAICRRNDLIFDVIRQWQPDLTGQLVLHAGPGYDGDIAARFTEAGATIVNVDIVMSGLKGLRERCGLEGVCADLRHLPFKPHSFQGVLCIEVIHHCHPIFDTFREIRRILKPGGHVYVVENTTTHPGALPGKILPKSLIRSIRHTLRRSFKQDKRYLKVSPYEQVISGKLLMKHMRDAGLTNVISEVSQYAIPVLSPKMVDLWERAGRRAPRLFRPFAFELTYLGSNRDE
jgi:ubiquinone/menaquinone biosynthesis C-methylase UbiE/uncharacterized protein YbaR (Trm112 family)